MVERRDRMCLTCVSQRQQHPRESPSRERLQTDKGKIEKIVLQISRHQHVCNVCGDVWFHIRKAEEGGTKARAPHVYPSVAVTKEVCVCV